jgi:hypothetical protein
MIERTSYPNEADAQVALEEAERARQRVIDQIGMPWWYWGGLAGCWIVLGLLADLGAPAWAVTATVVFGAAHSAAFGRLLAGRRRKGVEVRAEVAGRRAEVLVVGFLLGLVALTLALAFALGAAGEEHPVTWASVVVAVLILLGGPQVMARIRADASRRANDR